MNNAALAWRTRLAECVRTACLMEVMSPKPGNVNAEQSFTDLTAADFIRSADAVAPVLAEAEERSVGQTILHAIQETRRVTSGNTNLGIVLLLSPLAAVPAVHSLSDGVQAVLNRLTVQDSLDVYQAIRLAAPGGLGKSPEQDVHGVPDADLRSCMRLAADYDLIARQYVNGFQQVLVDGMEWLREAGCRTAEQPLQIQWLALRFLAEYGDSLIARKCGVAMSEAAQAHARHVLELGWPDGTSSSAAAHTACRQLDAFLRKDGNRRNPGTTADLTAAVLFAALREGLLTADGDWWKPV